MNVKTRFPPSPTGYLHVGSLRTALYNYLFAKKHKGTFLLRIEDTDKERLVKGATDALIKTLKEVGLDFDEGPFVQSERLDIYKEHAQKLIDQESAYYCFCSKERLDDLRKQQQIAKLQTKYDRECLKLSKAERAERVERGEEHVIRLKVPEGETTFEDEIRGSITIKNSEIDDQVLVKADGFPTYHLAVVVDDHLMDVTHVIRGEEWISSVPKHVILYNAFGFPLPKFAHLPLILNPDKSKLSKRQGDVAVEDYLKKGFLSEALINFVALLGFNPTGDREVYSVEELIKAFDLKKINKGGAVFDQTKLAWMNGQYLQSKTIEELLELAKPFVQSKVDGEMLKKILKVEKTRLDTLSELSEIIEQYVSLPDFDASVLIWKKADKEDAKAQLEKIAAFLQGLKDSDFDSADLIESAIKKYIIDNDLQNGNVLWPLRVALSGKEKSPSPFELLWVLGRGEGLNRIKTSIEKLS